MRHRVSFEKQKNLIKNEIHVRNIQRELRLTDKFLLLQFTPYGFTAFVAFCSCRQTKNYVFLFVLCLHGSLSPSLSMCA